MEDVLQTSYSSVCVLLLILRIELANASPTAVTVLCSTELLTIACKAQ